MRSASNEIGISLFDKINYGWKLWLMRIGGEKNQSIIPWSDIQEYERLLADYTTDGKVKLTDHQVLEIGYGARPWRLLSMASLGVDVRGIDLDRPTYGFNAKRLFEVLRQNGLERFLKSLVRGVIYDRADLKKLKTELKSFDKQLVVDASRMIVGNASECTHFLPDTFTFAFSEDVFEHIPAEQLPHVIENMKIWLKPGSIVMVRPHVYTGISGGHDPDLYPQKVLDGDIPLHKLWSHLLNHDYKVNTYLNRLRLPDYVDLFSKHFEILAIKQKYPRLGQQYLTPEIKEKLMPTYTEEELLSNQVAFIMRA